MLLSLILAATIGQTGGHIGEQEFWQGWNAAGGKGAGGDAYIDGLIRSGNLPPLPEPDHQWHKEVDPSGVATWRKCLAPGEVFDPNKMPVDFYKGNGSPARDINGQTCSGVPSTAGGTYVIDQVPARAPTPVNPTSVRVPRPVAIQPTISPVPIQAFAATVAYPSGITVSPSQSPACRERLARELATYPQGFLASIGFRQLVIGHDVSWGGRAYGGLTDVPTGTVFLASSTDSAYQRRSLHHEIYHLIDARLGSAGWPVSGGYISGYARTNPGEDRAETFADFMVNPSLVVRQSQSDPITKAKVDWMKARLGRSLPAFSERGY